MATLEFQKTSGEMDGSDESATIKTARTDESSVILHYHNDTDVGTTIEIYGSNAQDGTFDEAVQLSSETVNSGGDSGYYTLQDPWDKVNFVVKFNTNTNPTTGEVHCYSMDDG